jgi:Ca2+-binding RTX toxin-like protein
MKRTYAAAGAAVAAMSTIGGSAYAVSDSGGGPVDGSRVVTCHGRPATIVGNARDNRLIGTPGRDVIAGLSGNDTIAGRGGDDLICGGRGTWDRVTYKLAPRGVTVRLPQHRATGQGRDRLFGIDAVYGSRFADYLLGSTDHNTLNGLAGSDTLIGGGGVDNVFGLRGDDNLSGNGGNDELYGRLGNDDILGGDGHDLLYGEGGNDFLDGGAGHNSGLAGSGHDLCVRMDPVPDCEK